MEEAKRLFHEVPVWGWGLIGVGGVFIILRGKKHPATPSTSPAQSPIAIPVQPGAASPNGPMYSDPGAGGSGLAQGGAYYDMVKAQLDALSSQVAATHPDSTSGATLPTDPGTPAIIPPALTPPGPGPSPSPILPMPTPMPSPITVGGVADIGPSGIATSPPVPLPVGAGPQPTPNLPGPVAAQPTPPPWGVSDFGQQTPPDALGAPPAYDTGGPMGGQNIGIPSGTPGPGGSTLPYDLPPGVPMPTPQPIVGQTNEYLWPTPPTTQSNYTDPFGNTTTTYTPQTPPQFDPNAVVPGTGWGGSTRNPDGSFSPPPGGWGG